MSAARRRLLAVISLAWLVSGCCLAVVSGDGSFIAKLTRVGGGSDPVQVLELKPGDQVRVESSAGFWGPIGLNWQTRVEGFTLSKTRAFTVEQSGPRALTIQAWAPGEATLEVEIDVEGERARREVTLRCR